mmetsp:Transcript_3749/g.9079  ORF Transcript_3749/g.9079 Transcript_3749/m.9079 type:complete len:275 (-) Transcript_3749:501-1325(-)
MSLVVHSRFDAPGQSDAHRRLQVLQLAVHRRVGLQNVAHDAVVVAEVRHFFWADVVREAGVFLVSQTRHELVDELSFLQSLLHLHDLLAAGNHIVHQVHLRLSEPVAVRDVENAAHRGGVHAGPAARLQPHALADVLEVVTGAQKRDLHHHARAQPRAQVGWADQHVAKMVVVHEVVALPLHDVLHGVAAVRESRKNFLDICAHLHRNDARVIFLVDPHEKVLLVVEEDTAAIGPVATHPTGKQECRVGFLEQEVVVSQFLFFLVRDSVRLWLV